MLCIVGASGKLGFATLEALINCNLIPHDKIVCTTSSDVGAAKLEAARQKDVSVRRAHWDDPASFEGAFRGCKKLFLISSSRIQKDFHDAPEGHGREADHYGALEAAKKAGIQHVYYTSLAFAVPSKSRVMKAHERTEAWLKSEASPMQWTIVREGLYNESWNLYFGHFKLGHDRRSDVTVAGDSPISWTSIADLGLANALILEAPTAEWASKTVYLSQSVSYTLSDVAEMLSTVSGRSMKLHVVAREEHEKYYIEQQGMDPPYVKWWAKTYDALRDCECDIKDPTLERLLQMRGVRPKQLKDSIAEMAGRRD